MNWKGRPLAEDDGPKTPSGRKGWIQPEASLTDSSLPGFSGLKLQKMTIVLGLMEAVLWKVHFRRTSVPLTASTSPGVYTRIPLTRSTPVTHTHTQNVLLHRVALEISQKVSARVFSISISRRAPIRRPSLHVTSCLALPTSGSVLSGWGEFPVGWDERAG